MAPRLQHRADHVFVGRAHVALLDAVRTLTVLVAAVFALDLSARHPELPLQQSRAPWLVRDFARYAIFVSLGFLHHDDRLAELTRRTWAIAVTSPASSRRYIAAR